jgi:hypothetical protein
VLRAERPSSPADDLAARQQWSDADGLPTEVVAFCQSGISVIAGVRDPERGPVAAVALACRILPAQTVRILLPRSGNEPMLQALMSGSGLAVTFSRPITHRSIQLKGQTAKVVAADPEDLREVKRQCAILHAELVSVGYPASFCSGYLHHAADDLVAIDFVPQSAFVQTPGPGAGGALLP